MASLHSSGPLLDPGDRTARLLLLLICVVAAIFRFTGLTWGAPYFHFHIDEHYVFTGAETLRSSVAAAANTPKFFMYGPLPMWTLDGVRAIYERIMPPLVLTQSADGIRYMLMGRAISALFGTATVPLVYLIGKKVAGRVAGLLSAFLMACAVVQLRESHFFSVDIMMLAFATLAWWFAVRIVEQGRTRDYVFAGLSLGAAVACKYTALFVVAVIGVAHLFSARRPARLDDLRGWALWVGRGLMPLIAAAAIFAAVDPMIITYWDKAKPDIDQWVVQVNSGAWKPIFMAQFSDIQPKLFWFTNVLWWSLGPALEIAGLVGVVWLLMKRDRRSVVAAAFPIAYYVAVSQATGPFIRYGVPFAAGLAVSAGVLLADWLTWRRARWLAATVTLAVCGSTALYAAAYLHVFVAPDVRLTASAWLQEHVPQDSHILVEPTHNIPPMGSYRQNVDFNLDYVMWGRDPGNIDRHDYYWLHSLDTYKYLYDRTSHGRVVTEQQRFDYIQSRLALADWIVMDDTYVQFYQHLPASEHGVMKRYYRDLFAGRLGFDLVKTFKVSPSLFGQSINDDGAEMTFRLFDHPTIYVFARHTPVARSQ